jgi:hypothetical protein
MEISTSDSPALTNTLNTYRYLLSRTNNRTAGQGEKPTCPRVGKVTRETINPRHRADRVQRLGTQQWLQLLLAAKLGAS